MAGEHALPDTQPSYLGDNSCAGHAEERVREYAAMVHFVGLVAGVCGTADEQSDAKTALKQALEGYFTAAKSAGDAVSGYVYQLPAYILGGLAGQGAPGLGSSAQWQQSAQDKLAQSNQYFITAYNNVVAYLKTAYSKLIATFEQGKVMEALCKATIDFGFAVLENGAIIAVGGLLGVGPELKAVIVEIRFLATAVRESAESGLKTVAEKYRISLHRRGGAGNDIVYKRVIDTTKDLTEAEPRPLSEINQGTHSGPTSDAAPVPGDSGLTKWKKKQVNGRTVYQRDDLIDPNYVDESGTSNLQRMKEGLAPYGPDGEPINLHHATQDEPGAIVELSQTQHQSASKTLHAFRNQYSYKYRVSKKHPWHPYSSAPNAVDRGAFNDWTQEYWKTRSADFE